MFSIFLNFQPRSDVTNYHKENMAAPKKFKLRNEHFTFKPGTVELRFNEVPRDWENWLVKSRVRYIEVRFSCILL